jgi:thiol:disulfide interchange protein
MSGSVRADRRGAVVWFAVVCVGLHAGLAGCAGAAASHGAISNASAPAPAADPAPAVRPEPLRWGDDEASAFARARAEHKGVMIDFSATWCIPCIDLERAIAEPGVASEILAHFIPLKLDMTEDSDASQQQRARYQATTLPTLLLMTAERAVLDRVTRSMDSEELLRDHVRPAVSALTGQRDH